MSEFVDQNTTPSGGDTPASSTSTIVGTPAVPVAPATPQATPQAPATGAIPEGYVPSYRLREAREAAERQMQERYAAQIEAARREAEQYKRQLHSLVGVQPPVNPEIETVRQQFAQLYPGLAKLEEKGEDILGVLDRMEELSRQSDLFWQDRGRSATDRLYSHAAKSLGVQELPDEAKRTLLNSFIGFVQSSPEMSARYENDPSIVEDFWKVFSSSFIDPVRRNAATNVMGRVPSGIPQDTPSGAPRATPAPQMGSLDDRSSIAWQMYEQNRRA